MREIGSSGNRDIVKPNLTTETRRRGENREIQIVISTSDLTSSNGRLCSLVSFIVSGFSVLIFGNSWRIGVRA
jgi:hypothetical protein